MELKLGVVLFTILCFAWGAQAQVTCTAAGRYADTSDATCKNYTLCVLTSSGTFDSYNYVCPGTSLFNPASALCTTNYTCNVASINSTTNSSTTTVCTADGFIADSSSTNCSSYILCVQINGTFTEQTLTCPDDTYFNPNTTNCESTYNCTSTFTCSAAGRFADSTDTTCKTYYFCVLATNGTFFEYTYTCPSTSVFSPTSRVCTTSYTCS